MQCMDQQVLLRFHGLLLEASGIQEGHAQSWIHLVLGVPGNEPPSKADNPPLQCQKKHISERDIEDYPSITDTPWWSFGIRGPTCHQMTGQMKLSDISWN